MLLRGLDAPPSQLLGVPVASSSTDTVYHLLGVTNKSIIILELGKQDQLPKFNEARSGFSLRKDHIQSVKVSGFWKFKILEITKTNQQSMWFSIPGSYSRISMDSPKKHERKCLEILAKSYAHAVS